MIHILVVDDHPSVVHGTKWMLEQETDMQVSFAYSGEDALKRLDSADTFDIFLVDLNLQGMNGFELVKKILLKEPEAIVLIYTGYDIQPYINNLIEIGISGFIAKTSSRKKMVNTIRQAINGDTVIPTAMFKQLRRGVAVPASSGESAPHLNERELLILSKIMDGNSNKEIAEYLHISQRTLEYAITQIFHKLNVKSRKEAATKAKELGLPFWDGF